MSQKIVLVTGSYKGIGKDIVRQIAAHDKNYTVILTSRQDDQALNTISELKKQHQLTNVISHQLDLEDDASIEKLISWVSDKFGRLDTLVNNAGYLYGPPELTTGLNKKKSDLS